jgi:hypothetical protein
VSAATVEMLRRQLREKFPQACGVLAASPLSGGAGDPAGADKGATRMDNLREFPAGMLSEVVGIGSGWLVSAWLDDAADEPGVTELVLVDGADGFDPGSFAARTCARVLWLRCRKSAMEMIKAADWVVRDGNVPLVLVDACGLERRELAGVPAAAWWRLRQAAERTGCKLVVATPAPWVAAAGCRLHMAATLSLADFDATRGELLSRLRLEEHRGQRVGTKH